MRRIHWTVSPEYAPAAFVFGVDQLNTPQEKLIRAKLITFEKLSFTRTASYGGALTTYVNALMAGPWGATEPLKMVLHAFKVEIYKCTCPCWPGWENLDQFAIDDKSQIYASTNSEIITIESQDNAVLIFGKLLPFRFPMSSWKTVDISINDHVAEHPEGYQIYGKVYEASSIRASGWGTFDHESSPILAPGIFFEGITGNDILIYLDNSVSINNEAKSIPDIDSECELVIRAITSDPLPVPGPRLAFSTGYLTGQVRFPYRIEDAHIQFIGATQSFSFFPKFDDVDLIAAAQKVTISYPNGTVGHSGKENHITDITKTLELSTSDPDMMGENFLVKAPTSFRELTVEGNGDLLLLDGVNLILSPLQEIPDEIKAAIIGAFVVIIGGMLNRIKKLFIWFGVIKETT